MELLIIAVVSAVASLVTLFSGFGLGTILTPAFLFFFPVETAIALTGVVHFFNNIFKVGLFGKHAEWKTILRFGIPSVIGAFIGAELLLTMTGLPPVYEYGVAGKVLYVHPIKLLIAAVMIYFALMDLLPALQISAPSPSASLLPFGGLISGFFGGLSGHQGALRSAFLIRYDLTKEQFLAAGIIIACFVDLTRLSLYSTRFLASDAHQHWEFVFTATLSAFTGAFIGNMLLKKITISFIQNIVAVMLIVIAAALGAGVI